MTKPRKGTKDPTPVGGLTYVEIGRRMGISKQGVRKIEKRAIRKIKKKLKARYGYDIKQIKDLLQN